MIFVFVVYHRMQYLTITIMTWLDNVKTKTIYISLSREGLCSRKQDLIDLYFLDDARTLFWFLRLCGASFLQDSWMKTNLAFHPNRLIATRSILSWVEKSWQTPLHMVDADEWSLLNSWEAQAKSDHKAYTNLIRDEAK